MASDIDTPSIDLPDEARPLDSDVQSVPDPSPRLHLSFLDLGLDPLEGLVLRVTQSGRTNLFTTDEAGNIPPIEGKAGTPLLIEVQRFDGEFKVLEDTRLPPGETQWNYVSPQLVLEFETELHEGAPDQVDERIPQEAPATTPPVSSSPANGGTGTTSSPPSSDSSARPAPPPASAPPPARAPAPATPTAKTPAPAPAQARPLPAITGGSKPPIKSTPSVKGRNEQGHPKQVFTERVQNWWGSWSLPTFSLWPSHGQRGTPPSNRQSANPSRATAASRVPYRPDMLPKVKALVDFAEEQASYAYGAGEGTAAVLAQMAKQKFEHTKGEKLADRSLGKCYQYVRIALSRAGIVQGFVADKSSAEIQNSASLAGPPLLEKGFVDVTDEVPDARWAATGDVIVYAWSDTTWQARNGKKAANHGHIDIRMEQGYVSDFIPIVKKGKQPTPRPPEDIPGHPRWFTENKEGFHPNYVNIRIYRKFYDPRPTCRVRAFLACIREFECQEERDDTKRYGMLNAALPGHKDRRFDRFDRHPWDDIDQKLWPDGKKNTTAAGAYQITCKTWRGFVGKKYLVDQDGKSLFTPQIQERIAVFIMEENFGLTYVRKGDLESAVKALRGQWTSLPGANENAARRAPDGKSPMDMTYLQSLFNQFLAQELAKYGI